MDFPEGRGLAGEKSDRMARNFEMDSTLPSYPSTSPRLSSIHPVSLRSLPFLSALLSLHERTNLVEWISFIPASLCSPRTRGFGRDLE